MSLNLSLLMKMEAGQAKAELRAVQGELTKTGQGAKTLGASTKSASTDIDAIGDQSEIAAKQLLDLAAAEQKAARAAAPLENGLAKVKAGGTFAGNGLRVFSQQLSQVGQQTMATGQFVNALAIQLPDIGIAFGAAGGAAGLLAGVALPLLWSAFTTTKEKSDLAGEAMDRLAKSLDDYERYAEVAATSTTDLSERFGKFAGQVQGFSEYMAGVALGQTFDELKATVTALNEPLASVQARFADVAMAKAQLAAMPIDDPTGMILAQDALALYQDSLDAAAAKMGVLPEQARQLADAIDAVGAAQGPEQLAQSAGRALEVLRQIAPEGQKLPGPLREAAGALEEMSRRGAESSITAEELAVNLTDAQFAANALAGANIAAAIEAGIGPASRLSDLLKSAAGWFGLAGGGLAAQYGQYGAGHAASDSRGASQRAIISMEPGGAGYMANQYSQYGRGHAAGDAAAKAASPLYGAPTRTAGVSTESSGSGASAARAEKDAVAELIAKLREEQEVLAETDPIKSEMLKYRKQLADATAAERAEVEQLISVEQQLKAVREIEDFAGQTTLDFLDAIVQKGGSAKDAMRGLLSSLLKVATQALITGQGPLAGILGIKGGLFAGLFGGGVQAKAEGGLITGAGGPRDDKVPLWGSAGEFMMTGRATKRYRPVLERMNAGADIPGFANGGLIGASRAAGLGSGSAGGSRVAPVINIDLHSATGNAEIERMVSQGVQAGLSLHDREILPGRVKAVMQNQRVSGR